MLYVLGLSYGAVSAVLEALGWFVSKTTVYKNVKQGGSRLQDLRNVWLEFGLGSVVFPMVGPTKMLGAGRRVTATVKKVNSTGVALSLAIPQGYDIWAIETWAKALAREVGADVTISGEIEVLKAASGE